MWVNISYINLMRHRVPLDDFQLILNYEIMCVDWDPGFTFKQVQCTLKVPKFLTPPHKVLGRILDDYQYQGHVQPWFSSSNNKSQFDLAFWNDIWVCMYWTIVVSSYHVCSCLFHQVSSTPLLIFFSGCHLQFSKEDGRLAGCKVQNAWKGGCNREIHLSWLGTNLNHGFSLWFCWVYKWTHELL